MNKKIFFVTIGILVVIMIVLLTAYILKFKDVSSDSISKDDRSRLINYSYYGGTPILDLKSLKSQYPGKSEIIYNDFFEQKIIEYEKNEEFISSNELIYITSDNSCAIRGILKTTSDDSFSTFQDIEFIFDYGTIDGPEYIRYISHRFLELESK